MPPFCQWFPGSLTVASILSVLVSGTPSHAQESKKSEPNIDTEIAEIAGNEQVAEILRTRPGRGVMADDSQPTSPSDALKTFQLRDGLKIELVASEPQITQPLFLSWDSAGRMWVVQYRQYQYPAGLKVVRFDQHLRAVFDKVPPPPPNPIQGADVVSVLEDTDGDGNYDSQRDVIRGLNIATSVAIDRDGIWVLNPPYLLFYADANRDCIPDGDPEVHLSGFGLQDTHSVANSLMFGPDGWLYGANGSTTAGTIVSAATPSTPFEGQCIWRYHPRSHVFEIYAEGGGNTFSLDIDAQGRIFAGTNGGGTRGWYFPQGSYSEKNWGKHGPLTNPFAFGFLPPMKMKGDGRRFPQAFLVYDGGLLGEAYQGSIIAPNSMHNLVWHSLRLPDGSTFRTEDYPNLLESSDRWFRPVYAGVGPDGAVYLADWYDTRLSHVSPVDDWHKGSGRIYRVGPWTSALHKPLNLSSMTADQLLDCFNHPNKWVRQRAALELGWRQEHSLAPRLVERADRGSLEALWALSIMEKLTAERASEWLRHSDPHIRRWVVRLLGDRHEKHAGLIELAGRETDVEVRSQLAATAKRVPTDIAMPMIEGLLQYEDDIADPHLPLMLWWAVESHADDFESILQFVAKASVWQSRWMQQTIAERLIQRYAAAGTAEGLERCSRLLALRLDDVHRDLLVAGLNKAFQGRPLPFNLPSNISDSLKAYRDARGSDGIVLAARQGDVDSLAKTLEWLRDKSQDIGMQIEIAQILGEHKYPPALDTLLALATGRATREPALQRVALQSLTIYDDERLGREIVSAFDSTISAEHNLRDTACRTLASRKPWALALLREIAEWRVRMQDIPADVISQLRIYADPEVRASVEKAFGKSSEISSPGQIAEIERLTHILKPVFVGAQGGHSAPPSSSTWQLGEQLYADRCGKCHPLFGKGEKIGPPLDPYDRRNLQFWLTAIIAPSAEIREGFQSYSLLTVDGRVLTGMIASQDLNSTTIRTVEQQLITVANHDIDSLQAMSTSLMPEGLLDHLSEEQLLSLFQYLSASVH